MGPRGPPAPCGRPRPQGGRPAGASVARYRTQPEMVNACDVRATQPRTRPAEAPLDERPPSWTRAPPDPPLPRRPEGDWCPNCDGRPATDAPLRTHGVAR